MLNADAAAEQLEPAAGAGGLDLRGLESAGLSELLGHDHDLRAKLDAIEIDKPPFTKAVGLPRLRAHWVRPKIVVQVAFTEWTVYGKLRHPRLLGIRVDKSAREVVRERP